MIHRQQAVCPSLTERLECDGFAIVDDVLATDEVQRLRDAIATAQVEGAVRRRRGSTYAIRNLLSIVPETASVVGSPCVREMATSVLGSTPMLTRALLFDKTPDANWTVTWHQDVTVALKRRVETSGFGPWSVKAGIVHVRPPAEVLQRMLTIRVHLDDCDADNGALRVLSGSHRAGFLESEQIEDWVNTGQPITCAVRAGGAVLMRPLILHASAASTTARQRRVIHLEFAGDRLPGGLEWCAE
jgi:ectoine hydroxylase-related dioxygenase (phytanoyl-CoA dioxygenase family)